MLTNGAELYLRNNFLSKNPRVEQKNQPQSHLLRGLKPTLLVPSQGLEP
jgi:hypothetical protein